MHSRLQELNDPQIDGVRVWLARLHPPAEDELAELRGHLDPEETARADRFRFEPDRWRFIATRGLLRVLLGEILRAAPAAIEFTYGEHGKPVLAPTQQPEPPIHFNVTHSGEWGMFAVAHDCAVGIDLEGAERLGPNDRDLLPLAKHILSAHELTIWQALPNASAQRAAFLRAWTRKEACTKAIGRGVSRDFQRVEVALDAAAPNQSLAFRAVSDSGLTSNWLLRDLKAPAGFAAALAVEIKAPAALESTAPAVIDHAQGSTAGNF